METAIKISLLIATAFAGVLCGASLDQSFKQLPARHKIGAVDFSKYAKAADLKNGVIWYSIIGIGCTVATIITAFIVWRNHPGTNFRYLIYGAAIAAVCHSICTSRAAPIYFKQKTVSDEKSLARIFAKFENIQTVRSVFITLNFILLLSALAIYL